MRGVIKKFRSWLNRSYIGKAEKSIKVKLKDKLEYNYGDNITIGYIR